MRTTTARVVQAAETIEARDDAVAEDAPAE